MKPRTYSAAGKPTHRILTGRIAAAWAVALLGIAGAQAVTYFWDGDDGTAGFGTASGIWAAPTAGTTTAGWSTDATGATVVNGNSITTATTDTINFGNGATGLAAGTITVSGAVSTGNITFASGSGAIVLTGGTNITLVAAATITVDNASDTISSILAGAASLTKAGTGTLILGGANTYSAGTNVSAGTLQVDAGGTLTGAVKLGTGSVGVIGTVGNLTLNTSATVGAFSVVSNTATTAGADIGLLTIASPSTLTASSMSVGVAGNSTKTALGTSGGGTLTVNGAFTMGGAATTASNTMVVDLSGLANFNNINAAGTMAIGNTLDNNATLTLAATANTINVATLSIANTTTNYNLGYSTLKLGAGTNTLQASSIIIGQGKAHGAMQFAGSGGSVTINGTNGSGLATITLGNITAASYINNGTNGLLLAGHTATVNASTVIVSRVAGSTSTNGGLSSAVTFDTGTFSATSIQLALNTSGTAASATGTFTVGGPSANSAATGVVNVTNNFLLAGNTNTTAGTVTGSLTINGGTVNINTAASATGGIFDTSTNTTGTSATTLTLAGGTLDLRGGNIGGVVGVGKKNIGTLNFQSGTLLNILEINGGAALNKTTGGTLILSGTNNYTGKTVVQNGTVSFSVGNASATATQQLGKNAALDLGVASTSSGRLLYTGGTGELKKAVNALGNGTDTIENNGGGTLTLSGTITKDGRNLTL